MKELSIIPKPVSIKYREGAFQSKGLPAIKSDEKFNSEIETAKKQLCGDFEKMGITAPDGEKTVFCSGGLKTENDESYRLNILEDKITIEAASAAGAYHALQTFRQLVLSEYKDGCLTLPCAEINDYPRFSWRGFMLDCARTFYPPSFIKRLIDILSMHHISRFHWHLTDDQGWRFYVAEYPLLTEIGSRRLDNRLQEQVYSGGFYTEEQICEIVNYAAKRHIEVIPEVDLPGHASAILASYPGLGCTGGPYRVEDRFGIFEDVLCAGNNQIFDLAAAVFDTLARLFPSRWVHIGGDEVLFSRWENCPKCRKRLADLDLKKPSGLQSWVTQVLIQMLTRRGKIPIGWDEILGGEGDADSEKFPLSKEAVVMSWRGEEGGVRASSLGHSVIMTPNTNGCYLDYRHIDDPEEPGREWGISTVNMGYSMEPVPAEIKKENANLILGGQCNLWTEIIYAGKIAEYMIFPRLCAIAETVWTPKENKSFDDFSKRLAVHQKRLDRLGITQYRGPLK